MSLGLVAYDSSDESDEDSQVDSTKPSLVDGEVVKDSNVDDTKSADEISSEPQNGLEKKDEKQTATMTSCLSGNISDEDDEELKTASAGSNQRLESEFKKLSSLPEQKITKLHDIDFDWNQLTKNYKTSARSIKITVPSLVELDDAEESEPVKKKIKPSKSGSGLFALLPSPKNQFGNQVPRQIAKPNIKKPVVKPPVFKSKLHSSSSASLNSKPLLSVNYDDSPDEEEDGSDSKKIDFFSLDKSKIIAAPDVSMVDVDVDVNPLNLLDVTKKSENVDVKLQKESMIQQNAVSSATQYNQTMQTSAESSSHSLAYDDVSSTTSYVSLDSENVELDQSALQQLCGRKERKKGATNIQLIDVNGDEILPDKREWLTKQLTEEQSNVVQSHKKKDGPTTQQRRKHQITYLAFQAKEHELELKNQWANNRLSRKQTQAKYGF